MSDEKTDGFKGFGDIAPAVSWLELSLYKVVKCDTDRSGTCLTTHYRSIVVVGLCRIVSKIYGDFGRKTKMFPHQYSTIP